MNTAGIIETLLARKIEVEHEMEEVQFRLDTLKSEADRLETTLGVLEEIDSTVAAVAAATRRPDPVQHELNPDVPKSIVLSSPGMTIARGAELVLMEAGKALKNRQIAERMMRYGFQYGGDVKKLRNTVGVTLHRKAEDGVTFTKVAPGVFGLCEWSGDGC